MNSKNNAEQELTVRGRPRSDQSHLAILQATVELLVEAGYGALTIEAIAERAGVGKKTIYRWWPSKAAVALEALTTYVNAHTPFPDTGSLRGDLAAYFEVAFSGLRDEAGTILQGLVAEAQLDPEFKEKFQVAFIEPRRGALVDLLRRGIRRGELPAEADADILADLIYGAKWYRFLLRPAPLDEAFAEGIIDFVLRLK